MFSEIGRKIKTLASVICWIGIIGSVIAGIVMISEIDEIAGFSVMAGGALFSWIGSFFMYGFGELIDKTSSIEKILRDGAPQAAGAQGTSGAPVHASNSGVSLSSMKVSNAASSPESLLQRGLITEEEYKQMKKG